MKPGAIIEGIAITVFLAAGTTFLGCIAAAIFAGRFTTRTALIAIAAACIALAIICR